MTPWQKYKKDQSLKDRENSHIIRLINITIYRYSLAISLRPCLFKMCGPSTLVSKYGLNCYMLVVLGITFALIIQKKETK